MKYINKEISKHILMIGVYAGPSAKGGMASVILEYKKYFENLQYIYSWIDSKKIIKLFVFIRALMIFFFQMLFNKNIKIVHIHSSIGASFKRKSVFVKLSHVFGKKIILHIHGGGFPQYYNTSTASKQNYINTILKIPDRLAVISEYPWKTWFQEIGIHDDKIIVLNNPIETPQKSLRARSDATLLRCLFLGKLVKEKGIYDLLNTISQHKSELSQIMKLKICGFYHEDLLCNTIHELSLNDFVSFEGYTRGMEKVELLNWANILFLPSYFEAQSVSILEGMSYGLAVLASNVGGIPSIVKDGVNGLLFEPGNQIAIWESIKKLIDHPMLITELGHNGSRMVSEYYPNKAMTKLKNTYKELLYEK